MRAVCNVCFRTETSVSSDGTVNSVVDDKAEQILCSKCTQICSRIMSKVDWDMDVKIMKERFIEFANK